MLVTQDELILATDAGAILGKSARTVSRLAEAGQIPFIQKLAGPRGAYVFRRVDIERIAAELAEAKAEGAA